MRSIIGNLVHKHMMTLRTEQICSMWDVVEAELECEKIFTRKFMYNMYCL